MCVKLLFMPFFYGYVSLTIVSISDVVCCCYLLFSVCLSLSFYFITIYILILLSTGERLCAYTSAHHFSFLSSSFLYCCISFIRPFFTPFFCLCLCAVALCCCSCCSFSSLFHFLHFYRQMNRPTRSHTCTQFTCCVWFSGG